MSAQRYDAARRSSPLARRPRSAQRAGGARAAALVAMLRPTRQEAHRRSSRVLAAGVVRIVALVVEPPRLGRPDAGVAREPRERGGRVPATLFWSLERARDAAAFTGADPSVACRGCAA